MKRAFLLGAALTALVSCKGGGDAAFTPGSGPPVNVVMTTSLGVVKIQLDTEHAPISVQNFLSYVDKSFYDGTIFHRVIPGFMIQGGGFDAQLSQKPTDHAIKNESNNGLKNDRGTIAMARQASVNSATSQFFINVVDNAGLNYPTNGGYAVFGRVLEGMDVVDKIRATPTGRGSNGMSDVPVTPVVIQSIRRAP